MFRPAFPDGYDAEAIRQQYPPPPAEQPQPPAEQPPHFMEYVSTHVQFLAGEIETSWRNHYTSNWPTWLKRWMQAMVSMAQCIAGDGAAFLAVLIAPCWTVRVSLEVHTRTGL